MKIFSQLTCFRQPEQPLHNMTHQVVTICCWTKGSLLPSKVCFPFRCDLTTVQRSAHTRCTFNGDHCIGNQLLITFSSLLRLCLWYPCWVFQKKKIYQTIFHVAITLLITCRSWLNFSFSCKNCVSKNLKQDFWRFKKAKQRWWAALMKSEVIPFYLHYGFSVLFCTCLGLLTLRLAPNSGNNQGGHFIC